MCMGTLSWYMGYSCALLLLLCFIFSHLCMENAVTLEPPLVTLIHAPPIYPVSQSAAEFEHELKAFSYREFGNLGKSWPGREAAGGGSLSISHCPLPSGPRIQDLQLLIGLAVKSSPFFFHSALFSSSLLQTSDCFFLSVGALPDPLWLSPT